MNGKTVLITGGTSGIGLETARALARLGGRVIVTGRDRGRAEAALTDLRASGGNVVFMPLDLERMADVRRFAAELLSAEARLDVLINNAGAGYPTRKVTVEGNEASLATNHLGPFLLTQLLLPRLRQSARARIVNVSSGLHATASLHFDDLHFEKKYKGFPDAYARAKLAFTTLSHELARRLRGTSVTSNLAHPGLAKTNYARDWKGLTKFFGYTILRPFQTSAAEGARPVIRLASDPALSEVNGGYFGPPFKEERSSPASYDERVAKELWQITEERVGLVAT